MLVQNEIVRVLVQSEIDIINIGKGGALNRGLKLIKQLIRVFLVHIGETYQAES